MRCLIGRTKRQREAGYTRAWRVTYDGQREELKHSGPTPPQFIFSCSIKLLAPAVCNRFLCLPPIVACLSAGSCFRLAMAIATPRILSSRAAVCWRVIRSLCQTVHVSSGGRDVGGLVTMAEDDIHEWDRGAIFKHSGPSVQIILSLHSHRGISVMIVFLF